MVGRKRFKRIVALILSLCVILGITGMATAAEPEPTGEYRFKMVQNNLEIYQNGALTRTEALQSTAVYLANNTLGDVAVRVTGASGEDIVVSLGQRPAIQLEGSFLKVTLGASLNQGATVRTLQASNIHTLTVSGNSAVVVEGTVTNLEITAGGGVTVTATGSIQIARLRAAQSKLAVQKGGKVTVAYAANSSKISGASNIGSVLPYQSAPSSSSGGSSGRSGGTYRGGSSGGSSGGGNVSGNFLDFYADTTDVVVGSSDPVTFYAEVAPDFVPAGGVVEVYDEAGNLVTDLKDDASVDHNDDMAGDNVYSGMAQLTGHAAGTTVTYTARANNESSEGYPISFIIHFTPEILNEVHQAESSIEGAAQTSGTVQQEIASVVSAVEQQKAAGVVADYNAGADYVQVQFTSGINYVYLANDGTVNEGGPSDDPEDPENDPDGEPGPEGDPDENPESDPEDEPGLPGGDGEETGGATPDADSGEGQEEASEGGRTQIFGNAANAPEYQGAPMVKAAAMAAPITSRRILGVVPYNESPYPAETAAAAAHVTSSSDYDYAYVPMVGSSVSVDALKSGLSGYEVVIWDGHGGYSDKLGSFVGIGQFYNATTDQKYQADLQANRVIHLSGNRYGVTSKFFNRYYDSNSLTNTFFYFGTCKTADDANFAKTLINKGAAAVLAYQGSVLTVYNGDMMDTLFAEMSKMQGQSTVPLSDAMSTAKAAIGQTDASYNPTKDPAELILFGDGSYVLYQVVSGSDAQNMSFEQGKSYWYGYGDFRVVSALGTLKPTHGNYMALLGTGMGGSFEDDTNVESALWRQLNVSPNQKLVLDYNFVSEEPMEWVGTQYDDTLEFYIHANGQTHVIGRETVNTSNWIYLGGDYFWGGDDTTYHTGWQTLSFDLSGLGISANTEITLEIKIWDEGDSIYDSVVLVDNVRFE